MDEIVRGPASGEVFTIIARSHVGKSLVATNIMANNPESFIVFFSLEMPAHQVLHRLASHVFNYPARDLELDEMTGVLPEIVDDLTDRLPHQVVVDDSGLSLDEMSVYLDDYATYYGQRPQLVIMDYLEEIEGSGGEGAEGTLKVASLVKRWAKSEKVGVVLLHQSNMRLKNYVPPDQDAARMAGYTQADVVIGLWRPGWDPGLPPDLRKEREHWFALNVLKNRVRGIKHDGFLYRIDPALRVTPIQPWELGRADDFAQVMGLQ